MRVIYLIKLYILTIITALAFSGIVTLYQNLIISDDILQYIQI